MKFPEWLHVYGDADYRGDCPKETLEQVTFFNRLRAEFPDSYGITAIHPRNEGKRTMQQAVREKAEGMVAGAADIIIPGCPALVLELKRRDHTKSSFQKGQLEYLEACHLSGSYVCVALGADAAWEVVQLWDNLQTAILDYVNDIVLN